MKNLVREHNLENLQKNMIKAKYLKKLSYIAIIIDLVSFIAMETLKLIYTEEEEFIKELLYFTGKVK